LGACLLGCSGHVIATPPLSRDATSAPGHLVVLRESQVPGAAVTVPVAVDGTAAAELGSGEYVDFQLAAGPHLLAGRFLGNEQTERFRIEPGATQYFKFHFSLSGNANDRSASVLEKLSTTDGDREVASGRYKHLS